MPSATARRNQSVFAIGARSSSFKSNRIGSLGRVAGPVRAERQPASIDRLDDVRSQVRQGHEDYSDSPNEIVVKKCRSLVNASRSRIVGRRHVS